VDEAEWLACSDSQALLAHLGPRVSVRQLRLFACVCVRQVWHLLGDERSRRAIEVAERYADGEVKKRELRNAIAAAEQAAYSCRRRQPLARTAAAAALSALRLTRSLFYVNGLPLGLSAGPQTHADLLRDIVGNPFRSVVIDPGWLCWTDGAVRRMAQALYEERNFGDLPILADALEDAGCTDADILTHLRGPGPHVRGCWVLDGLLERG
jgi:hypothetical protein